MFNEFFSSHSPLERHHARPTAPDEVRCLARRPIHGGGSHRRSHVNGPKFLQFVRRYGKFPIPNIGKIVQVLPRVGIRAFPSDIMTVVPIRKVDIIPYVVEIQLALVVMQCAGYVKRYSHSKNMRAMTSPPQDGPTTPG